MKLQLSVLIPALCCSVRLVDAASAHVYIHDPTSEPRSKPQSKSLEPVPARLVLAQRAGVEEYHSSDLSKTAVIDAINEYGVRTPLFSTKDNSLKKATILVERDDITYVSLEHFTSFAIAPAPEPQAARGLFVDLAKQSDPQGFARLSDHTLIASLADPNTMSTKGDMFHIAQSMSELEDLFIRLAKTKEWLITAIIIASQESSSRQGQNFQWGAYEMPGMQAPLKKREQTEKAWSIYEDGNEERLTQNQPATSPVAAFADNTSPLRGILPACFNTLAACESTTRNCTGHGSCQKKYHDSLAGDQAIDCYACACVATKSGDRTTNWGGPACQKKDISVQFWLITLFTVGMIFLVGFAVGSVWEMGQQELPSVIGAGVSGPSARK